MENGRLFIAVPNCKSESVVTTGPWNRRSFLLFLILHASCLLRTEKRGGAGKKAVWLWEREIRNERVTEGSLGFLLLFQNSSKRKKKPLSFGLSEMFDLWISYTKKHSGLKTRQFCWRRCVVSKTTFTLREPVILTESLINCSRSGLIIWIHPFTLSLIQTSIHQRRCPLCKAAAGWLGAMRVCLLAQGNLDTKLGARDGTIHLLVAGKQLTRKKTKNINK